MDSFKDFQQAKELLQSEINHSDGNIESLNMISDLLEKIFHGQKDLQVFKDEMKVLLDDWERQNQDSRNRLTNVLNAYENNLNM